MKWNRLLLLVLVALVCSYTIGAIGTFENLAPSGVTQENYAILATSAVNFSFNLNVTGIPLNAGNTLNCTVYNRSSFNSNFSKLFPELNVTNATFVNVTNFTLAEGRTYWYWNCSTTNASISDNGVHNQSFLSTERIVDIDLDYYTLTLGTDPVINFSLDKGNATFKSVVTASAFVGDGSRLTGVINTSVWNSTSSALTPNKASRNITMYNGTSFSTIGWINSSCFGFTLTSGTTIMFNNLTCLP